MKFGLIGYPLGHSFSKAYFNEKFQVLGHTGFSYDNFPLVQIEDVYQVLQSDVFGLNVTIPYKTSIIDYLNDIDLAAYQIGAVNTLVRSGQYSWKGYNTDASGFRESLLTWIRGNPMPKKALILGSGGASKAVAFVLAGLGVQPAIVSRTGKYNFVYEELSLEVLGDHHLIVNTTPLGMEPDVATCPEIPFKYVSPQHWLYDLVYNPTNTLFLTRGRQMGARTKNGLDMLHLQAEHAWSIWKTYGKF